MAKIYFMQHESGKVISTTNPECFSAYTIIPAEEGKVLQHKQAKNALLSSIKPGATVYTILRKVSSSGNMRVISLHIIENGEINCIDYDVSTVTGYKIHPKEQGLIVRGSGMDMGYDVVHTLGRALWPDGSEPDNDGGYAFNQRWI